MWHCHQPDFQIEQQSELMELGAHGHNQLPFIGVVLFIYKDIE